MIELLQKEGFSVSAIALRDPKQKSVPKLSGRRQAELALEEVAWSSPKARVVRRSPGPASLSAAP